MRFLICPDSYKGSADAYEAACAMRDGILSVDRDAACVLLPMADGGEGSVSVLCGAIGAEHVYCNVQGPYGESVRAGYAMHADNAYIEMAEASGLCLTDRREPLYASTYGTGELMADAVRRGARTLTVFIGGSATCDGGMGMAAALGYRFLDSEGNILEPNGENMAKVGSILPPEKDRLEGVRVYCACDVTNPIYGERGAAHVFAPQKGADPDGVRLLDRGLKNLACVIERCLGANVHSLAGGGAAGGLGAGLYAFCGAQMKAGFSLISDILSLERCIEDSDVIITGEGCTDSQSMMGKVVGNICELCKAHGKVCIVISGLVKDKDLLAGYGIAGTYSSSSYAPSPEESMANAAKYIRLAAAEAARALDRE